MSVLLASKTMPVIGIRTKESESAWLERFYRGEPALMETCYREHFDVVMAAAGMVTDNVDRESVVHDVFYSLLASEETRRRFRGGSLSAWLRTIARNRAIDLLRTRKRHRELNAQALVAPTDWKSDTDGHGQTLDAKIMIERFRKTGLPAPLAPLFQARFITQLSQREAAKALGIRRTTLAYREKKLRKIMQRFFLTEASPDA